MLTPERCSICAMPLIWAGGILVCPRRTCSGTQSLAATRLRRRVGAHARRRWAECGGGLSPSRSPQQKEHLVIPENMRGAWAPRDPLREERPRNALVDNPSQSVAPADHGAARERDTDPVARALDELSERLRRRAG
jgi:hypothetical protein